MHINLQYELALLLKHLAPLLIEPEILGRQTLYRIPPLIGSQVRIQEHPMSGEGAEVSSQVEGLNVLVGSHPQLQHGPDQRQRL